MPDRVPGPGVRGRLLREGLERNPSLSPEQLADLLNREHGGLGVTFRAEDVRHARHILRDAGRPVFTGDDHLLFTDRIPPMREHENPALREPPAINGAG